MGAEETLNLILQYYSDEQMEHCRLFAITINYRVICFKCCVQELELIKFAVSNPGEDPIWEIKDVLVNETGHDVECAHCHHQVPSD